MSDGAIVAGIIVYLLGLTGVCVLLDFAEWYGPWWTPVVLFWPIAVLLGLPLAGVAGTIDLITRLLFGYGWLADLKRQR